MPALQSYEEHMKWSATCNAINQITQQFIQIQQKWLEIIVSTDLNW